ncbi:MAG: hypothetical protein CSA18_02040 [Deltaproteobacteria bacterium]|nr:MAG: hypothetical protein CSB21_01425 [Deltaproteobacteria bacterium]PIE74918.1 MAG: hypothetical protein CSA18_02040 [Deltaproteobacteria bacterium]
MNLFIEDIKNYIETLEQYGMEYFVSTLDSTEKLNRDIINCNFCSFEKKFFKQPFINKTENTRVLFVISMPENPEKNLIFSKAEKNIFIRIISAMKLKLNEISVISAARCHMGMDFYREFKKNFYLSPCADFFKRSIDFINPEILCFLGKDLPDFIDKKETTENENSGFLYEKIPYYSTYSLKELLDNPGLKKEAWVIFQKITGKLLP